jgi:hypothetical protein
MPSLLLVGQTLVLTLLCLSLSSLEITCSIVENDYCFEGTRKHFLFKKRWNTCSFF